MGSLERRAGRPARSPDRARRLSRVGRPGSASRLDTDYIDLYQMHRPDYETGLGETLSALADLVRSGKIRAFASSMLSAGLITQAQWASRRQGSYHSLTAQHTYCIFTRKLEAAALP